MLKQLPNALTALRLILAPFIALAAALSYEAVEVRAGEAFQAAPPWSTLAAILFVVAALTDFFDGLAARALNASSKLGRMLDPIADKALVGLPLVALSFEAFRVGWPFWAVIASATGVIVCRDAAVTALRLTAPDGEGAPVSRLAKWKTALELATVGLPLLAAAVRDAPRGAALPIWVALLLASAALSAWTGLQYVGHRPAGDKR